MVGFTQQAVTDLAKIWRVSTRQELIKETKRLVDANQSAITSHFGTPATIEQVVDGQKGKALDQALKFTDTTFHLHANVVDEALKMLIMRSPIGPGRNGHYKDAHWLYINGHRRDAAVDGAPIQLKAGDKAIIINVKPYARKIEGTPYARFSKRLTNRRPGLSSQAPDGVYEVTARDLQKLYGKIAIINFTYRGNVEGALLEQATVARAPRRNKRGRFHSQGGPRHGNDAKDRFPALEIEARV